MSENTDYTRLTAIFDDRIKFDNVMLAEWYAKNKSSILKEKPEYNAFKFWKGFILMLLPTILWAVLGYFANQSYFGCVFLPLQGFFFILWIWQKVMMAFTVKYYELKEELNNGNQEN